MKLSNIALVAAGLSMASTTIFAAKPKTEEDKVSYVIGYQIGSNFKKDGIKVNTKTLVAAMQDALNNKDSALTPEESQQVMTTLQNNLRTKAEAEHKASAEKNKKEGEKFLADNKKKKDVKTLPSGLQYKVIKEGKGKAPSATDIVKVHYKGTLLDGSEFDSSYKRGEPATFPVNGVIKGWTEALQLMKPGSKWALYIPSELGYGERGTGGKIGPNATLIFDVELLEIEKKEQAKKTK